MSLIYKAAGEVARQEEVLGLARQELEQLARIDPDNRENQQDLVINDLNRAYLLESLGRLDEAEELYREIRRTASGELADGEAQLEHSRLFGEASLSLGRLLSQHGRHEEALVALREGVDECRKLVQAFTEDQESRVLLARLLGELGAIHLAGGDVAQAESQMRASMNAWRPIVTSRESGQVIPSHIDLSTRQMLSLGALLYRAGKPEEGETLLNKGVNIADAVASDNPDAVAFQIVAATAFHYVGLSFQEYHAEKVSAAFERAVAIRRELVRRFPENAEYLARLGAVLNDAANWRRRQEKSDEARKLFVEAIGFQRTAIVLSPRAAEYRQYLRNHYTNLIETLLRMSDHQAARAATEDMLRELPDTAALAAAFFAECERLAGE